MIHPKPERSLKPGEVIVRLKMPDKDIAIVASKLWAEFDAQAVSQMPIWPGGDLSDENMYVLRRIGHRKLSIDRVVTKKEFLAHPGMVARPLTVKLNCDDRPWPESDADYWHATELESKFFECVKSAITNYGVTWEPES